MFFMDLEETYDRINKEAQWQALRMYDVGAKLLSGIKSMYVNSLACLRASVSELKVMRNNVMSCPFGSSTYILIQ